MRPRKPEHLKLLQGNAGKRSSKRKAPTPKRERPRCPDHLPRRAKRLWRELVEILDVEMEVLTVADRRALELLVDSYDEWREARAAVRLEGAFYWTTTKSGDEMARAHPAVAIADAAHKRMKALLEAFGLTPTARARLSAEPGEEPEDPFNAWRNRRGRRS